MSPLLRRLSSRRAAQKQHLDFIADHCQREVQMMSKGGHKEGTYPNLARAAMVNVVHRTEDALRI